jgi:hypothetical protein
MRFYHQPAVILAALLVAAPATAANLLINGGFESAPVGINLEPNYYAPNGMVQQYPAAAVTTQYLSGWTIATPAESNLQKAPYANYSWYPTNAYEGSQFFSLNWSPDGNRTLDNTISQAFSLGAASSLQFSIAMTTEFGFVGSTLQVTITNSANAIVAQSGLFSNTQGIGVWDLKNWAFDLDAGNYSIALHGLGAGNAWDVILDDARLEASPTSNAVPEPATWAMMIGGLGLVGASIRRRKVSISFA